MEIPMAREGRSLRAVVEHWLDPIPENPVRVTKFKNRRLRKECYVCVETLTSAGLAAMFFFRHEDGVWRVFPPNRKRPAMNIK